MHINKIIINPSGLTIAENDANTNAIYENLTDLLSTSTNADVKRIRKSGSVKPCTEFKTRRGSITNKNAQKNANFLEMNILLRKNTGIAVNADNQIERFSCRIIYEIRLSKENI
tara:strand:+ start:5437 stop:5778 length:342 start_codon:yes stop_codon:yes gene_type:complete